MGFTVRIVDMDDEGNDFPREVAVPAAGHFQVTSDWVIFQMMNSSNSPVVATFPISRVIDVLSDEGS